MRRKVETEVIVSSDIPAQLLRYCPDLAQWPQKWAYDDPDIVIGERIVQYFTPFLLDLLEQKLASKTLRRHRDNMWLLGGEVIRQRYESAATAKKPIDVLINEMVQQDGGPFMLPRVSEDEQESFDATCRKYYRFLHPA
jgi:hypothetical protein